MPNWKKLIVSGSDAILGNITASNISASGDISASSFSGPGQIIVSGSSTAGSPTFDRTGVFSTLTISGNGVQTITSLPNPNNIVGISINTGSGGDLQQVTDNGDSTTNAITSSGGFNATGTGKGSGYNISGNPAVTGEATVSAKGFDLFFGNSSNWNSYTYGQQSDRVHNFKGSIFVTSGNGAVGAAGNITASGLITASGHLFASASQSTEPFGDGIQLAVYNTESGEFMYTASSVAAGNLQEVTDLGNITTKKVRASGLQSLYAAEVSVSASAGWYRVLKFNGNSRGGGVVKLSTTGGNFAPATWVIKYFKTYGDPASRHSLKLEQYGNRNYITKARIVHDSGEIPFPFSSSYVEVYKNTTFAGPNNPSGDLHPVRIYQDELLGYAGGTLSSIPTTNGYLLATDSNPSHITESIEMDFITDGTSMEYLYVTESAGIGVSTPTTALQVNGTISSSNIEASGDLLLPGVQTSGKGGSVLTVDSNGRVYKTGSYSSLNNLSLNVKPSLDPTFAGDVVRDLPLNSGSTEISKIKIIARTTSGLEISSSAYPGVPSAPGAGTPTLYISSSADLQHVTNNGSRTTNNIDANTYLTQESKSLSVKNKVLEIGNDTNWDGFTYGFTGTGNPNQTHGFAGDVEITSTYSLFVGRHITASGDIIAGANSSLEGKISASGHLFASASENSSVNNVALYDTTNGQFYYTASNQIGGGGGSVAGSNKQIQFNDNGIFGGNPNFTYNKTNNELQLSGAAGCTFKGIVSVGVLTITSSNDLTTACGGDYHIQLNGNSSVFKIFEQDFNSTRMTIDADGDVKFNESLAVGTINPSSTVGRIDASNDIVAYSTSDERLKKYIKPIPNALDKVSQIRGVEFDWKTTDQKTRDEVHSFEGHDVGVLAQEIEKVLPEVVTTRNNGYKAVKYEKIVPLLIESIKELKAEIEELKKSK